MNQIQEVEARALSSGNGALIRVEDIKTGKVQAIVHLKQTDDYVLFTGPDYESKEERGPEETIIRIRLKEKEE